MKSSEKQQLLTTVEAQIASLKANLIDLENQRQKVLKTKISYVDFSTLHVAFDSVAQSFKEKTRKDGIFLSVLVFSVRHFFEYKDKGVFLGYERDMKWEIVKDSSGAQILIPSVNKIQDDSDGDENDK